MTGGEFAQLTTAIGVVITSLASLAATLSSLHNGRKIEQVHLATNSLQDKLVTATAVASKAEGKAEGVELGRAQMTDRT